ncbi:hypothetical protein LSM04_004188 [Trypanosoma melophagium]|uniref:uncharacterized protein n=1 Tax=Trypanosoma melophagium TaxID=715481 RepID=UPI00351A2710|nr:hypothetical protein LSM04_004188 [Trypanosoma melophagium]
MGMKDCNNDATSLKSRADLLTRLDYVIKQVHERLTALDNEMAGITQAYEAEYWERIRRVEHLRDTLTTRNSNINNNCDDMNKNGVEKDDDNAEASVTEEKREELLGVLEKAINKRLNLKQE